MNSNKQKLRHACLLFHVSFVNCFVVILLHHNNLLLLALTLVQYDHYSITGHPN